jgi:hypothetical protein
VLIRRVGIFLLADKKILRVKIPAPAMRCASRCSKGDTRRGESSMTDKADHIAWAAEAVAVFAPHP